MLPSTPFVSRMKLHDEDEHRDKSLIFKSNSSNITKKVDSLYFHKVTRNGVSVSFPAPVSGKQPSCCGNEG